ncbi:MAG: NAD synthetase [Pseudomonas sp.]|uniref:NAD synthetase n=1 Tax=Pseudomonas sp. TaxID=306 RepID=UPI003D6FE4C0
MSGIVIRDGFSIARSLARDRIEHSIDLEKLFHIIDADPAIVGAGVVFIDSDFNVVMLREFQPVCSVSVKRIVLREAPRYLGGQEFAKLLATNERESGLVLEAVGAFFACGGAILSWCVVYGGVMAAPLTLGTSAVFTILGKAAVVAGTIQCGIAVARVAGELLDPSIVDDVDSNIWYQWITAILDGITLAGASASVFVTVRYVLATKAATRKSYAEILRGLSRQERLALTTEVHKYQKELVGLPSRYTNSQIKRQTYVQIGDLLAAGSSVAGSLLLGNLSPVAVAVYGEF